MMHETKIPSLQLVAILLLQTQMVLLLLQSTSTYSANIALPGCPDNCNGIPIPYPFGIGDRCSLAEGFNVTCAIVYSDSLTPYLYRNLFQILNISIPLGQGRFNMPIFHQFYNAASKGEDTDKINELIFDDSPLWLNEKNKFIVTGCNTLAYFTLDSETGYSVGCLSTCDSVDTIKLYGPSCSGIGCCQTALPKATQTFLVDFDPRYNHSLVHDFSNSSYAMVVEDGGFQFTTDYATSSDWRYHHVPVIFDWVIGNTKCQQAQTDQSTYACKSNYSFCLNSRNRGYICNCTEGYQGNPYLQGPGSCQDIDECSANQNPCPGQAKCHNLPGKYECLAPKCAFGRRSNSKDMCVLNTTLAIGICASFVVLAFLVLAIYIAKQKRNLSEVKKRHFQEHGGWILWNKIKSNQGSGFRIFTEKQVEQATNSFDKANIIGQGGQGTVYKGTLQDETVAIKKCKIVNESKKKEFGKEMDILSQINHKNIVKLLGCCLEVEVPMLVYEFIPNGTLLDNIRYDKHGTVRISLPARLRIAQESAEALAYLHSSASPPILHGDVKPANILLDHNYTGKVSDFGASVLAPTDGAQFVTFVQGTHGYLDPEYFHSGILTEKSDVYSLGVVLVELLTSKPVIVFTAPEEEMFLGARFLSAMKDKKLCDLLDDKIVREDDMELAMKIAELAERCLHIKGEDRPTMKEVAEELDRISKLNPHPWREEIHHMDMAETLLTETSHDTETKWMFQV